MAADSINAIERIIYVIYLFLFFVSNDIDSNAPETINHSHIATHNHANQIAHPIQIATIGSIKPPANNFIEKINP
jgi:hypothetical protein|tara:strand:- start:287 stop:511 length:225 start_codon:yes stop_codon:yes gene_type:complete